MGESNKKVVNLTPYTVDVCDENGCTLRSYISRGVARASFRDKKIGQINETPLVKRTFGPVIDLPQSTTGTYYIVSLTVAQAAKAAGRTTKDLLLTANNIKDRKGAIIGCTSFTQL